MRFLEQLPADVGDVIRTTMVAQFATTSAAGVPIDTPTVQFSGPDETTIDVATGLAYPAKAERARRNPKVGLLLEGGPGKPTIAIAGLATVRDADLQANMLRYLAETALMTGNTSMTDWEVNRAAVWYYTRIFICITPVRIRWWPDSSAMHADPQEWHAPAAAAAAPPSDPAPSGPSSSPPAWPQPPWPDLAAAALTRGTPAYLTILDEAGFPLPIPAHGLRQTAQGVSLSVPRGIPWRDGKASLSFAGIEMFVGDAVAEGDSVHLHVERALPVFPLTADSTKVLRPDSETRAALMKRLGEEAARRGQAPPAMPDEPPLPTSGAVYRAASSKG